MGEKSFERFGICALLSRRSRDWPAAKGIKAPCLHVRCAGPFWITCFQRLGLRHVAISDATERLGPFVIIRRVDGHKGFAHVGRIKPNEGIHAVFGALYSFGFDFVERALAVFLRWRKSANA